MYADQDLARQVAGLLLQRAQEINGFASASGSSSAVGTAATTALGGTESTSAPTNITATSPFLATLDEWEKSVYRDAQRARRDAGTWRR